MDTSDQKNVHREADQGAGARRGLLSYIPSAIVLAAIAAVGAWGHQSGWTAPKFADLAGGGNAREGEDWCAEHSVPESMCIKCRPELVGADMKDWCPEHGVPESKCTICHPEILTTGVAGDWCPEHEMPESSCTICHPEIAVMGEAPGIEAVSSQRKPDHAAVASADDAAASPGHAEHDHSKDPRTCQTHATRVQFASAESIAKAGVSLVQVGRRAMAEAIVATGETEYDRSRLAGVSSPAGGRVWKVLKRLGEEVKAGEVIALVESPEVGEAKGEILQATADLELTGKTLERLKASAEAGFRTRSELQEAEAAAKAAQIRIFAAQQRLANLGLAVDLAAVRSDISAIRLIGLPAEVQAALGDRAPGNLLPLTSPLAGTIISQEAIAGESIEENTPVFQVADVERMWVRVDLPGSMAGSVSIGQEAAFIPEGEDTGVRGKITWIDTAMDEQTRTLRARIEVANPDRRLKAGVFGQVQIERRQSSEAAVIPADALQWEGCCDVVFVRLADTIFQTRKVKIGARSGELAEVTNGVLPGEVIASAGSHVLKAEILKGNLGAGCADH